MFVLHFMHEARFAIICLVLGGGVAVQDYVCFFGPTSTFRRFARATHTIARGFALALMHFAEIMHWQKWLCNVMLKVGFSFVVIVEHRRRNAFKRQVRNVTNWTRQKTKLLN